MENLDLQLEAIHAASLLRPHEYVLTEKSIAVIACCICAAIVLALLALTCNRDGRLPS